MSTDLTDYFFNTTPDVVEIETLEISHPHFTVPQFRVVRNAAETGITVTHDGGPKFYSYVPMEIKPLASQTDLDQDVEITLGDLGEILGPQLENIENNNGFLTKPVCTYRTFRSDDTSAPMLSVRLRIDGLTLNRTGAAFKAKAASYNITRTGEIYSIDRIPMLEGLT